MLVASLSSVSKVEAARQGVPSTPGTQPSLTVEMNLATSAEVMAWLL